MRTWIALQSDTQEWKIVQSASPEDAAEAAERDSDPPDDSNEWDATWIVAVAPDDFDDLSPTLPDPEDFNGQAVTVQVKAETTYTYRVAK